MPHANSHLLIQHYWKTQHKAQAKLNIAILTLIARALPADWYVDVGRNVEGGGQCRVLTIGIVILASTVILVIVIVFGLSRPQSL